MSRFLTFTNAIREISDFVHAYPICKIAFMKYAIEISTTRSKFSTLKMIDTLLESHVCNCSKF